MLHLPVRPFRPALLVILVSIALMAGSIWARAQSDTLPRPAAASPSAEPAEAPPARSSEPAPTGPAAPTATALLPHDLSPWAMFRDADIVVKAVMVGLAFASLVTWTVWFAKTVQLVGARHRAVRGVRALMAADRFTALGGGRVGGPMMPGPVAALVHAADHELHRSADLPADGIKERAAIALGRVEARAARGMTRGTGVVATIGSTAPFVGLFGTVWGIMNSFVGISQAHTTNLAVVAPGIAEALLATAIGLVAAIPAVIIYNQFARGIAGYKAILSDASAEVMRHLSRDLDRRAFGPAE